MAKLGHITRARRKTIRYKQYTGQYYDGYIIHNEIATQHYLAPNKKYTFSRIESTETVSNHFQPVQSLGRK